ncbi:MAG: ATP-binding protein [Chloroflexi bacterium]|nr:ATP-binding protein [Chloroflexota bacterium]
MSIRTRLTIWYTSLLAISLLVFGALIYSLLAGILTSVMDDRLAGQAQDVIGLIQNENDPVAVMLSGRVQLPSIDVFASQYFIQIVQADGEPVQLSENLQGQRLPMPDGIAGDIANGRTHAYTIDASGGVRLRVASVPFVVARRPVGAVLVAQSLTDLDAALTVVRSALLIGALTSLLLAAVGGVILARAALRPIQAITTTARQITQAQDLSQRIPVAVPNDEVGRLTSTINDMLARLETLFQAQQRLVADVSHELRTPLTTIQGNLDLLRRGAAADPAMRGDALRAIGDETARMRRMVNDLLLLAQADAGLKLRLEPVELDTLLLEVYRQTQVLASSVTVRLGAEDQATVMGDQDRLRQLLLNLVDNAMKYTPAGGTVTLGLSRRDGWAQVAVSDTGMGIAAEDLPHIFERFYRADRSRGRSGGSGLGLPIAGWIAQAHGGRIEVTSQMGQGSIFTMWLPELTADEGRRTNEQMGYSS